MKNMAGKVTGPVTQVYWEPPLGLQDPKNPTTKVTINSNMEYILTAKGTSGINLVKNGDFEQGKTGFYTDYIVGTMSCYGLGFLDCEGTYDVLNNPQLGHAGFAPCKDHTSGGGLMMVLNGAASFQNVWCQTVPVMPNMDYIFTAWITSVVSASPPILQFNINGMSIGPTFNSSGSPCLWEKYEVIWNSGSNTSADICILNENTNTGGNDFAIDDISFVKICEVKDTMQVLVEEIIINIEDPGEVNCDRPQLKIDAKGSSQGKGWTYTWYTANGKIISGGNTLEPVIEGPGTYELTICSDLPGCCKKAFIEIMGNIKKPDLTIAALDSIGCNKDSVTIFTNSSVNPLNYNWEGPGGYVSNEQNPIVKKGGTYTVTVIDEYNCKTTKSVVIFENSDFPKISIQSNNINCQMDSAILKGSSTILGSVFEWTGPKGIKIKSDSTITRDSGLYVLKVVTPSGCTKFDSVRVRLDQDKPDLTIAFDTINCLRDSAFINVKSNSKLINTTWSSVNSFNLIDTFKISTKSIGKFKFIATRDNFCVDSIESEILADTVKPLINTKDDTITCKKLNVPLISGKTNLNNKIEWTGPGGFKSFADSVNTNQAGKYLLKVTGSNQCEANAEINIWIDTIHPNLTIKEDTITCLRDSVTLSLTDQYASNYQWTFKGINISSMKNPVVKLSGRYSVFASLPNGCTTILDVEIAENLNKPIITAQSDTLNCLKDSIPLMGTADQADAKYLWIGPGNYIQNIKTPFTKIPGRYKLIVTNSNGCKDSISVDIIQDVRKPDLIVPSDTLNCQKKSVVLIASSTRKDLNYFWSGPNNFSGMDSLVTITNAGTYKVKVIGPDFCSSEAEVNVAIDTVKPNLLLFNDTLNCKKRSIILAYTNSGNLASDYSWSGPGGYNSKISNPSINIPGRYKLIAQSANYCVDSAEVNILIDTTRPTIQINSDTINCVKKEIQLKAFVTPSTLTGNWSNGITQNQVGNNFLTRLGGIHTFSVEGGNYCINSAFVDVLIDTVHPKATLETDVLNCQNRISRLNVIAQGVGNKYQWLGPGNYQSNNSYNSIGTEGTYTVTVTSSNGCELILQTLILIDTLKPVVNLSSDSIDCKNKIASIKSSIDILNGKIKWTNAANDSLSNNNILQTDKGGIYFLEVENTINHCKTKASISVVEDSLIIRDVKLSLDNPKCNEKVGSAQILQIVGGHSGLMFSLDDGKTFFTRSNIASLDPGQYSLLVVDDKFCEFRKNFNITPLPFVESTLQTEIKIKLGDSGILDLNLLPDPAIVKSIQWSPTDYLSCSDCEDPIASPLKDQYYEVVVIDTNGCKTTQRILVKVEDPQVWVPNVFSPNGDQTNDDFYVFSNDNKVTNVNILEIFDRWGSKVFSIENQKPNDPRGGWNGNFRNKACNPGVYVYWIEVELINGKKYLLKGDITLIR